MSHSCGASRHLLGARTLRVRCAPAVRWHRLFSSASPQAVRHPLERDQEALNHAGFSLAAHNFTNDPGGLSAGTDKLEDALCLFRLHDNRHANTHVEDLIQLFFSHAGRVRR